MNKRTITELKHEVTVREFRIQEIQELLNLLGRELEHNLWGREHHKTMLKKAEEQLKIKREKRKRRVK